LSWAICTTSNFPTQSLPIAHLIIGYLEMGASYQPLDSHNHHKPSSKNPPCFVSKPVCALLACGFVSLALLHLLCCSPAGAQRPAFSPLLQYINNTYYSVSSV
jgi:xyloglucan O-acetyltransferase